jgi:hypothetical protein
MKDKNETIKIHKKDGTIETTLERNRNWHLYRPRKPKTIREGAANGVQMVTCGHILKHPTHVKKLHFENVFQSCCPCGMML